MAERNARIKLDKVSWGGLGIKDLRRLVEMRAFANIKDVDIVTVLIGANDFGFDIPIEEFECESCLFFDEVIGLFIPC